MDLFQVKLVKPILSNTCGSILGNVCENNFELQLWVLRKTFAKLILSNICGSISSNASGSNFQ